MGPNEHTHARRALLSVSFKTQNLRADSPTRDIDASWLVVFIVSDKNVWATGCTIHQPRVSCLLRRLVFSDRRTSHSRRPPPRKRFDTAVREHESNSQVAISRM